MIWNYLRKSFSLLNMDAWSDGQTESKLWLCRELERLHQEGRVKVDTIWVYGSWYGTLVYLLLARERLPITKVRCFDIDKNANKIANKILNRWFKQGLDLQILDQDCLELNQDHIHYRNAPPDLIINTSCEHLPGYQWWSNVPHGTCVVAQSTNMAHPTHINCPQNLEDFAGQLSSSEVFYRGEKYFEYPELNFTRLMVIAKKI
jgi:hypothetical protein